MQTFRSSNARQRSDAQTARFLSLVQHGLNGVDNYSHLRLNARMYICICNAVTDHDIQNAVADGVRNFEQLRSCTGCSSTCGCCEPLARKVFAEALSTQRVNGFLRVVDARAA